MANKPAARWATGCMLEPEQLFDLADRDLTKSKHCWLAAAYR